MSNLRGPTGPELEIKVAYTVERERERDNGRKAERKAREQLEKKKIL